jgi:exonuclease III
MYHHGGAVVQWPVSAAMTEAGFKDSFREVHPDAVKDPGTTWLSAREGDGPLVYNRQDRIDYIYYRGNKLKAVAAETFDAPDGSAFTFHGREFMYPSDHGFVFVTFRLD